MFNNYQIINHSLLIIYFQLYLEIHPIMRKNHSQFHIHYASLNNISFHISHCPFIPYILYNHYNRRACIQYILCCMPLSLNLNRMSQVILNLLHHKSIFILDKLVCIFHINLVHFSKFML